MKLWIVFFKGGDEDRPHRESFCVDAEHIEGARKVAMKEMREVLGIMYPEIYQIEKNGNDLISGA